MRKTMQRITPFLWFDTQAEEAVNFYVSIFKNSRIGSIAHYEEDAKDEKNQHRSIEEGAWGVTSADDRIGLAVPEVRRVRERSGTRRSVGVVNLRHALGLERDDDQRGRAGPVVGRVNARRVNLNRPRARVCVAFLLPVGGGDIVAPQHAVEFTEERGPQPHARGEERPPDHLGFRGDRVERSILEHMDAW